MDHWEQQLGAPSQLTHLPPALTQGDLCEKRFHVTLNLLCSLSSFFLHFDLCSVQCKKRLIWLAHVSKQSVDKKGLSIGERMKRRDGGGLAADDVMRLVFLSDPLMWLTVYKHIGKTSQIFQIFNWSRQPCSIESAVLNVEVCFDQTTSDGFYQSVQLCFTTLSCESHSRQTDTKNTFKQVCCESTGLGLTRQRRRGITTTEWQRQIRKPTATDHHC